MFKYLILLALISCALAGDSTFEQWSGDWVVTGTSGSNTVACVLPEVGSLVTISEIIDNSVEYYYYDNGNKNSSAGSLKWTRNTTLGLVTAYLPWTAYYEPDYTPQPSNFYVPPGTCYFPSSGLLSCAPNVGENDFTIGNNFQNFTGLPSEIYWSQGNISCSVYLIQYY